jgi:F-type H+-transporting ATPase subunit b
MLRLLSIPVLLGSATAFAAEAPHAGKPGMPQLDPSTYSSQVFWLVVTFVALYVVMSRVALPKVRDVLTARAERLQGDLEEAQRLKAGTEKAIAEYEAALAQARAKAQATAGETRLRANKAAADAKARQDADLAATAKAAEAGIGAAKDRALASLNDVAAETARDIVQRLSGVAVTVDAAKAAVATLGGGR